MNCWGISSGLLGLSCLLKQAQRWENEQYSRKEREEGGKKTLKIYEKAIGNHTIFIYLKLHMIHLSIHVCIHTHNLNEVLLLGLTMFPLSHGLLSKNQ